MAFWAKLLFKFPFEPVELLNDSDGNLPETAPL